MLLQNLLHQVLDDEVELVVDEADDERFYLHARHHLLLMVKSTYLRVLSRVIVVIVLLDNSVFSPEHEKC